MRTNLRYEFGDLNAGEQESNCHSEIPTARKASIKLQDASFHEEDKKSKFLNIIPEANLNSYMLMGFDGFEQDFWLEFEKIPH